MIRVQNLVSMLMCCTLLGASVASHAQLTNASFTDGLDGWDVDVAPASSPGEVAIVDDGGARAAELKDGTSFLVTLAQSFVVPARMDGVAFDVTAPEGWGGLGQPVPDAFEVHLVDEQRRPLTPTWRTGATAFHRQGDDGRAHEAEGVSVDGSEVRVVVPGLAAGSRARLVFHLIGGDDVDDTVVHVSNVRLLASANQAPTAAAGDDVANACAGIVTLDASGSNDPDGDTLLLRWTRADGSVVGEGAHLQLTLDVGQHTFTLHATDPFGATSVDDMVVDVVACADAGVVVDGGVGVDGGQAQDAGVVVDVDGGVEPSDAGGVGPDAGGTPNVDGGSAPGEDGGNIGTGDAGTGQGVGEVDAGTTPGVSTDCSCDAALGAQSSSSPASGWGLLVALLWAARRRRGLRPAPAPSRCRRPLSVRR